MTAYDSVQLGALMPVCILYAILDGVQQEFDEDQFIIPKANEWSQTCRPFFKPKVALTDIIDCFAAYSELCAF